MNRAWWGEKTVMGSAAVLVVTFLTISYPVTLWQRILLAVAAMVAEAVGGAYDNLMLVAVVLAGHVMFNPSR